MSTLYRARVARIDGTGVYVEVSELGEGAEWGPLEMLPINLSVGDAVLVGTINDIAEDMALIGVLVTDNPAPTVPANGKFILVYENETARTAAGLTLVSGLTTWLDDEQRLDVYTDETVAGWVSHYGSKASTLKMPAGTKIGVGTTGPLATLNSVLALSTDPFTGARVTGDSFDRFVVDAAGICAWGSGSLARDTNLYRSAANTLKTDDAFHVAGDLAALASVDVGTDLVVNGTTTVEAVVGNSTLTVSGLITAQTDLSVGDDLTVTDDASVGGDLTVTGNVIAGSLTVNGNVTINGDLTVNGDLSVTGIGQRRFIDMPIGQTSTDATTWVSVTNSTITIEAGAKYWLTNRFSYDGPTASDFQHRWTSSDGTVITDRNTLSPSATSTAGSASDVQSINLIRHGLNTARAEQGFGGSTFPTVWEDIYVSNPTGSQQTITLQFMQATAGGGTSTFKGGYIVIERRPT